MKKLNLVLAGLAISAVAGSALANVMVQADPSCKAAGIAITGGKIDYTTSKGSGSNNFISHTADGEFFAETPAGATLTNTTLDKVEILVDGPKPGSITPYTWDASKDSKAKYALHDGKKDPLYTVSCDGSATDPQQALKITNIVEQ